METISKENLDKKEPDAIIEKMKEKFGEVATSLINTAQDSYGKDLSKSTKKALQRELDRKANAIIEKQCGKHLIEQNVIEMNRKKELEEATSANEIEQINRKFDEEKLASQDIPPQKTNQIYTPKKVVIEMVDMLEQENPNCFDDENKTFIDLYMKSGLYITEIVKRLYGSEKLKKLYPDRIERLKHIFEKQVYGLAPTEIIYRIATAFILGFDDTILIKKHNLRQFDTLPSIQAGTLETDLDEVFG